MVKHKRLWIGLIGSVICVLGVLGTYFDAGLYQQPIIRVTRVQTISREKQTDEYQNEDTEVVQRVTGQFLNTKQKGQVITLRNTYTASQAMSTRYYKGQQVFLHRDQYLKKWTLNEPKRDTIIVGLTLLTFSFLLLMMLKRGLMTLISVLVNLVAFVLTLHLNAMTGGRWLLPIMCGLAVVLTGLTLLLVLGPNRQMLVSYGATIGATFLALFLSMAALKLTGDQGLHYETMAYELQPYKTVFLAEVVLGILGAVMDETTDISSSLQQLAIERPNVTKTELFKSGLAIGREIIGPLVNVLFFLVMADAFPIILLYLRNGNTIAYTLSRTVTLSFTQTVISAIGITLAVPVTSLLASRLVRVRRL